MSINVNGNSNQIDLQKLLKQMQTGKAGRTRMPRKAPGMSMNESIFMVSGNRRAQGIQKNEGFVITAEDVANVNTTRSINGMDKPAEGEVVQTKGTASDANKSDINIDNIDFDNLADVTTEYLKAVHKQLKDLIDGDAPFFLRKPFEQKLNKVKTELDERASEDGNKLSDDNKKTENKEDLNTMSKNGTSEAKSGTKETQKATENMNNMSSDTQNLKKDIEKSEKNLNKTVKATKTFVNKNIKAIAKENKNIEKLNNENEQINDNIEDANSEIATISQGSDDSSQEKINDLTRKIETLTAKSANNSVAMGKSNVAIRRYTAANNGRIRKLTKSAKVYNRTMVANQNQIESNKQESNKTLETATKFEQVSQKIAAVGTITKFTGIAMMACQFTAAAGAVLKTTGTITETAGNYGVCAANITKTAVYAAQGNITGALTSVGSAIMSGTTAVGNTKQLTAAAKNAGGVKSFINNVAGGEALKVGAKESAKVAAKETKMLAQEEAAKTVAGQTAKQGTETVATETAEKATGEAAKTVAGQTAKQGTETAAKEGTKKTIKLSTKDLMQYGTALTTAAALFGNTQRASMATGQQRTGSQTAVRLSQRRRIA